jgi:sec-independent protein translocase protein TatB
MFDLAWTEILVIAIVLIVVVGPKDLPKMLRSFGRMTSKMSSMAGDFRKQFDEAMREAELDDVKKTIDSARKLNPAGEIRKALNPMENAAQDVKTGLDLMMKKDTPSEPASTQPTTPAEPLKAGPAALPGEAPVVKPNGAAAASPEKAGSSAARSPAAKPATKAPAAKSPAPRKVAVEKAAPAKAVAAKKKSRPASAGGKSS